MARLIVISNRVSVPSSDGARRAGGLEVALRPALQHNGGVFLPPWGKSEQWLISVQHDHADIERLNRNVGRFAACIGSAGKLLDSAE